MQSFSEVSNSISSSKNDNGPSEWRSPAEPSIAGSHASQSKSLSEQAFYQGLAENMGECAALFEPQPETPTFNFLWANQAFKTQFELHTNSRTFFDFKIFKLFDSVTDLQTRTP